MKEHALEAKIKNAKNHKEKWRMKNAEFEKLEFPLSYSVDGLDIEILSARGDTKDLLEIQLNVFRDGEILNVNAPFLFQNPPVKVPNGKKKKEKVGEEDVEIDETEVNIKEALKQFVLDTVKTQIK